jgi:hypothetical protein
MADKDDVVVDEPGDDEELVDAVFKWLEFS